MKNIRLLLFAYYTVPYKGNFLAGLMMLKKRSRADKVVMVFPKEAATAPWAKEMKDIYFLSGNFVTDTRFLAALIKKERINLIHSHFSVLKYDLMLKLARRGSGATYVRHMHMLYKNKRFAFLEKLKRRIADGDVEIACSACAADAMYACGYKNIYTVENGIDFSRFDHCDTSKREAKTVMLFGYNYHVKGVDIALRAIRELHDPAARLLLCVTTGVENIKAQITAEFGSIPPFVEFLPATSDVGAYFARAHVFLSASREESYCFALREATYCGCVPVASNIAAHVMNVGEILFKVESYTALADKLREAFATPADDPDKKAKIATACSLEKWSDDILAVYNTINR